MDALARPYLIAFVADNGGPLPHSTNAPYRGGKHTLWVRASHRIRTTGTLAVRLSKGRTGRMEASVWSRGSLGRSCRPHAAGPNGAGWRTRATGTCSANMSLDRKGDRIERNLWRSRYSTFVEGVAGGQLPAHTGPRAPE